MRPSFLIGGLCVAAVLIGLISNWSTISAWTDGLWAEGVTSVESSESVEGSLFAEGSLPAEGSLSAEGSLPAEGSPSSTDPVYSPENSSELVSDEAVASAVSSDGAMPDFAQTPASQFDDELADAQVRTAGRKWQLPGSWFDKSELVARTVGGIAGLAAGGLPDEVLDTLKPERPLATQPATVEEANRLMESGIEYSVNEFNATTVSWLTTANYARYDTAFALLDRVDPVEVGNLARALSPAIERSLAALGYRQSLASLLGELVANIDDLPNTPMPQLLIRPNVAYEFANANVESLSPLHKQLIRIGPQHSIKLRRYLVEIIENLTVGQR